MRVIEIEQDTPCHSPLDTLSHSKGTLKIPIIGNGFWVQCPHFHYFPGPGLMSSQSTRESELGSMTPNMWCL